MEGDAFRRVWGYFVQQNGLIISNRVVKGCKGLKLLHVSCMFGFCFSVFLFGFFIFIFLLFTVYVKF